LLIHNFYQESGGEDQVFYAERSLLEENGHSVYSYTVHNDQIPNLNKFSLALSTLWNKNAYQKMFELTKEVRPDVVHFHNTFPLLSPSVFHAFKKLKVPVVLTLHNFRLLCPNGFFFRDQQVCEDCLGKIFAWPAVLHSCYRSNQAFTLGVSSMLGLHKALGTWTQCVDIFVSLTDFTKQKFIEGGIPGKKVVEKPNFISSDPGIGSNEGTYAIFVGRLSHEKGVLTMLEAWKELGHLIPLKVVGVGPLHNSVIEIYNGLPGIEFLGRRSRDEVFELMKSASVLIFPSECYENLPMTILEAYAVGLPVIASDIGSMKSLVLEGLTGIHFMPGNIKDLSEKLKWLLNHPEELSQMRLLARKEYENKYTATKNHQQLMEIYSMARTTLSSNKSSVT